MKKLLFILLAVMNVSVFAGGGGADKDKNENKQQEETYRPKIEIKPMTIKNNSELEELRGKAAGYQTAALALQRATANTTSTPLVADAVQPARSSSSSSTSHSLPASTTDMSVSSVSGSSTPALSDRAQKLQMALDLLKQVLPKGPEITEPLTPTSSQKVMDIHALVCPQKVEFTLTPGSQVDFTARHNGTTQTISTTVFPYTANISTHRSVALFVNLAAFQAPRAAGMPASSAPSIFSQKDANPDKDATDAK